MFDKIKEKMVEQSVGSVWKNVAIFLMGMNLTLAGTWVTHIKDEMSRAEIMTFINRLEESDKLIVNQIIELKIIAARNEEFAEIIREERRNRKK